MTRLFVYIRREYRQIAGRFRRIRMDRAEARYVVLFSVAVLAAVAAVFAATYAVVEATSIGADRSESAGGPEARFGDSGGDPGSDCPSRAAAGRAAPPGSETAFSAEAERLIPLLGDPNPGTRSRSERRLVEIGPAAVPALEKALGHRDPEVRWRAFEALGEIRKASK